MKKTAILLILALMLLSLAGCGQKKKATTTTPKTSSLTTNAAALIDMAALVNSIWEVHAGSSGCSIRAEETAEKLVEFSNKYGEDADAETITTVTKSSIETAEKTGLELDMNELKENFEDVVNAAYETDETLKDNEGFTNITEGIRNALN